MNEQQVAEILKGLKSAIRAEFEGYHFYMMASRNTDDPDGRETFQHFARDEFEHMNFLQAQFDSLVKNHQPDETLLLKKVEPSNEESSIFTREIMARIQDAHQEMTILSVGIQLELNALQMYRELSREAGDPIVAGFYRELSEWESSHYRRLIAQQDALKDAYWSANHFHPF